MAAGVAGLAASHAATMALTLRTSPVVAVAEFVIEHVPGQVAENAIEFLGNQDKPVLVGAIVLILLGFSAWAGRLALRAWWLPVVVWVVLGGLGLVAVLTRYDAQALDVLPVTLGVVTWIISLSLITEPLRRADARARAAAASASPEGASAPATTTAPEGEGEATTESWPRRSFIIRTGLVVAVAAGLGTFGELFGRKRRHVERIRRLLSLPVTNPSVPPRVDLSSAGPMGERGLDGLAPWRTPAADFYRIDTAIVAPAIYPKEWSLRIHGMVEREITLSYQELLDRPLSEDWVTLNCVSNPVGGDLIGNAWWSGIRLNALLEEAGLDPRADAVLQTSHDGWTCGTPLGPLTDDRIAMLAVAMNGQPLPIDHGFPVRTLVPGLFGYVSACKWVVDIEVTRFADIEAYWTGKGWSERGPVKLASRIDTPRSGDTLEAGKVRVGGSAWEQMVGIERVQIALDGGAWRDAEIAEVPNLTTWVQWTANLDLEPGDHTLRVRAVSRDGAVQTGVERDVRPNGATGWHEIDFNVE